jgi:cytochrome c peroxidase
LKDYNRERFLIVICHETTHKVTAMFASLRLLLRLRQGITACFLCLAALPGLAAETDLRQRRLEDLGRALFFDVNLSQQRTQSCATCHDPARAFTDWRDSGVGAAASLGDDGRSLGDRQAPSLAYAAQAPAFHKRADDSYAGGQFWDGRAATLAEQAEEPPLNPIEMGLPDSAAVAARLQENPQYAREFPALFGADAFRDADATMKAFGLAVAAFESIEFFSPFDSRYDRYLRGDYQPTAEETLGITLFFSDQFANCNQCHQLQAFPEASNETFTSYSYENIGVPANQALRMANGLGAAHVDSGLLKHPAVDDPAQAGRFKVPTLRNVALTAPYMHNGVFAELRTVLLFYNRYLARGSKALLNPETGAVWGEPEVADNVALEKLQSGRALDERSIEALLAFLRMLTDQRYEALLK